MKKNYAAQLGLPAADDVAMPPRLLSMLVAVALGSCRIEPTPGDPYAAPDEGADTGSVGPPDEPGEPRGGSSMGGGNANGGRPSNGGSGASGGVEEPPAADCAAEPVTLDEIRSGAVLPSVTVALVATATSQKFLLSETEAGSCLWGAFVGDEPESDAPRGVVVVSYGDPAPGGAACEPGTDAIPDEITPGDVVRIVGRSSSFVPANCGATVAVRQVMADARCPFERLERTAPPDPAPLPLAVATNLARGDDPALVRTWAGGLVRLDNVSALPNETGDGAVRPYGVVALAETELEVHADIEYGDLTAGGPRDASKGLDFPYPTAFRSIVGLVHLDYCDYVLAPRGRCDDFEPPSAGCR